MYYASIFLYFLIVLPLTLLDLAEQAKLQVFLTMLLHMIFSY